MRKEIIQEEQQIAEERLEAATPFKDRVLHRPIHELPNVHRGLVVGRDATVRTAIEKMNHEQIDGIVVVEQGRVVGVCNTHDICKRMADRGVDIDHTQIGELMRPDPECLKLEDEIAFALHKIHAVDNHPIPIVDMEHRAVGMVSLQDIIGFLAKMYPQEVLNLPPSPEDDYPPKREGA